MAQRRRRKQNPNTSSMLLLAGAGVAAYLAYVNGWFSSFTTVAVATPKPTTGPGSTGNPVGSSAIVGSPGVAQPLGTPITNANDLAATAAANPAYIVPTQALFSGANPTPAGYVSVPVTTGTPAGVIFLRKDIADKDLLVGPMTSGGPSYAYAPSTPAGQLPTYGNLQLPDLTAGISGLRGGWGY